MSLEAWGDEPYGAGDDVDIERLLGKGYRSADDMTKAAHDVIDERLRQQDVEGWTPEHDDEHSGGQMARAAACYASHASAWQRVPVNLEVYRAVETSRCAVGWPWSLRWWKPKDPRRDLVRAAALLLAEIERLDRIEAKATS